MIDQDTNPARSDGQAPPSEEFEVEPALSALTEQITRRLQSGDAVDAADYAQRFPEWADALQTMLPTIRELIELGRSVARTNPSHLPDSECPNSDLREDLSY